ncbi:hypothetical protein IW261DRAFT_1029833 [Armillaria novae-zelandiae]|uniref:Uncharacterized protein n=1 Tax=Armillaria novae-zelandiae TaxID=153914 RepID=A0AA39UKC8_9AGAR|nr:hypothetical protein IW261DRAFT_1029833 [Armillaria novae-zelandiae]
MSEGDSPYHTFLCYGNCWCRVSKRRKESLALFTKIIACLGFLCHIPHATTRPPINYGILGFHVSCTGHLNPPLYLIRLILGPCCRHNQATI